MTANGGMYTAVDAATLRAAAHRWPGEVVAWPDLSDAFAIQTWMRSTWRLPGLREAVWVASPDFAARVDAVCAEGHLEAKRGRRMVLTLARYLVRARRRATPFGLFAGVAALRFGPVASVTFCGRSVRRVRPDAGWIADVIARFEADPGVRHRLLVQVNNLAVVRGARIVVDRMPHASATAGRAYSVRNTEAVQLAVSLAAVPVPWAEVVDTVATAFRGSARTSAEALVADLVRHGVLITALRPPSTCEDPLRHIVAQLDVAHDHGPEEPPAVNTTLRSIRRQLSAAEHETTDLAALAGRMRRVAPVAPPLAVDLRVPDQVVLPEPVAAEVSAAVEVLRRLTPDPAGRLAWRAYRARFVDRYGTAVVVPLADLLDSVTGLGYPDHYGATGAPPAASSARGERLLTLAQQAVIEGVREVMLDDAAVAELAGTSREEGHISAHVDVSAEVRAASVAALDDGRFTVALTGMGRSAMATSGRFLDVLPPADRERMCERFAEVPVGVYGAMPVQLSFPPSRLSAQNVLRCRQVLPWLLPLGEHREVADDVVGVEDLGVAAGRDRLVLVSISRRRVVEPTVAHAAAMHTMPLLARFLIELPRCADARLAPFDWGAASRLPFRPALRYGRTVLTAARWRIDPARLPAAHASDGEWLAAWALLRATLRLPAWVQIGNGDQRLRLHLDQPMDRALLRAHINASDGPCTLVEAAEPADFGWFSGRAHEIVVPVASTAQPDATPNAVADRRCWLPPVRDEPVLPGIDGLVSVSLAVEPSMMDQVLLAGLPALFAGWDTPPRMWFIRRCRPVPHLRLRLHTDDFGNAAARIGRWAAALRRQGLAGDLSLDTYHPERGRYGAGPTLAAAERLFAADSAAALAQMRAQCERRIDRQAITAASLIDLAAAMLGDRTDGCEWLVARPERTGGSPLDRDVLRQAVTFDPAALPEPVRDAWQERARSATRYADALSASAGPVTPDSVLASLLHLHHIRTHGPDEAAEQVTCRLARHIALATVRRRALWAGAVE